MSYNGKRYEKSSISGFLTTRQQPDFLEQPKQPDEMPKAAFLASFRETTNFLEWPSLINHKSGKTGFNFRN